LRESVTVYASREWYLLDAGATRAAGKAIGEGLLCLNDSTPLIITLHGDLGAGKTTLVGGMLNALGHQGPVRSPTYTLIEPYDLAGRQFYHLDLYRLTDPLQLEELGVRDLLQPGAVLLVEWPERAGSSLDKADLQVHLAYPSEGTEGRQLRLQPGQESLCKLVHSLSF
jgi:tRNA threonylcarbamoyladenosine biosynthesis protein TsaE